MHDLQVVPWSLQVNDLYARVIPLRSDMNYGIANISNLNTVSASHTASIINLQGRMATAEGTLATAVRAPGVVAPLSLRLLGFTLFSFGASANTAPCA